MAKTGNTNKASRVPSGRVERIARFGVMAGGLAAGALAEGARRWWDSSGGSYRDIVLNPVNARQLAVTLSRMRGAAMKLGQLLSLEGDVAVPAAFAEALSMLRASGDTMTASQLHHVLGREYGHGWQDRFRQFEEEPVAAASIGQVHRAIARDGREVALKVQFPGVAKSIGSDVKNLAWLLRATRLVPVEYDLDPLLAEVKRQLAQETDYVVESKSLRRFRGLIEDEPGVEMPEVYEDLTTKRILAMEYVYADPIQDLWTGRSSRRLRDDIGRRLQRLVFRELFEFRFMQSDPNFANYMVDPDSEDLVLLDFGSTIEISADLSERYRQLLAAGVRGDIDALSGLILEFGWIDPHEPREWVSGIAELIKMSCEPMRARGRYDYGKTDLAVRAHDLGVELSFERGLMRPPPPEMIFIQRKLGGTYHLCSKLGARVSSADMAEEFLGV